VRPRVLGPVIALMTERSQIAAYRQEGDPRPRSRPPSLLTL
jgi:hypothetical protein